MSTAILAALSLSRSAAACRCVDPSAGRAYALGDLVVLGSVESQEQRGEVSVATFVVERAWKLNVPRRIKIIFGGACPFPLQTSGRYLLYGTRIDAKAFGTRRCRGNRPYAQAGAPLDWLRRHGTEAVVTE